MNTEAKKKYLATFVQDASIDFQKAALSGWKNPVNPQFATKPHPRAMKHLFPFRESTVEEHDRRYHGGHYNGGACSWREQHGMKTWPVGTDASAKADYLDGVKKADLGRGDVTIRWEGSLGDRDEAFGEHVAKAFTQKYNKELYAAMGEDGNGKFTFVRDVPSPHVDYQEPQTEEEVYEVSSTDIVDDDVIEETVAEMLPGRSADLDPKRLIGIVAAELTDRFADYDDWGLIKARGRRVA